MKIQRLDLLAFGPFTDRSLDFNSGHQGLHLVYGPNEAGKSSALRALRQVLYGIPERTSDDFIHRASTLRVGITLENSRGGCLSCIRRRGRGRTLLAADNSTPFDDGAIEQYLGGLSKDAFEMMFGIDHRTLVAGGQDIVHFKGEVGEVLFAAAGGVAGLQEIQNRLLKDAEDLFAPQAKKPRINSALSELHQSKQAVRDAQFPSKTWAEHTAKHENVCNQQAQIEKCLQDTRREYTRLDRLTSAIPLMVRRRTLRDQLAGLSEINVVPETFTDKRINAVTALNVARTDQQRARTRIAKLDVDMQAIVVPHSLVERGDSIEHLSKQLGSYLKAQRDLPLLQDQRDQCLADARGILSELRPDLSLDNLQQLKLTTEQKIELQNLGTKQAGLLKEVEQSERVIRDDSRELQITEAKLAELEQPRDASALANALRRVSGRGKLEDKLTEARRQLCLAQEQATTDLARLTLWSGALDELEKLPIPSAESIETSEEALRAATERLKQLRTNIQQIEADQAKGREEFERLRLAEGQVPTEDDLTHARQLRDRGWELVKWAWQKEDQDPARVDAFVQQIEPSNDLAGAYERTVCQADEVVDRLRREADRVAHRARLEVDQRARDERLRQLLDQQIEAEAAQSKAAERWQALWKPLGIVPLSPKEMRAWLGQQQQLVQQAQCIRQARSAVSDDERRIEESRQELSCYVQELGEPSVHETETLIALEQRGADVVRRIEETGQQRIKLVDEIRRLTSELDTERKRAETARESLSGWMSRWSAAVVPLGLPVDALPSQAHQVLQEIGDLNKKVADAAALDSRIKDIGRDTTQFTSEVEQLARDVGVDPSERPVDELTSHLVASWRQAGQDQTKQATLEKERASRRQDLVTALTIIEERTAELAAMCEEASCTSHEDLPTIEQDSARVRQLSKGCQDVEQALAPLTGGMSLDDFAQALAVEVADELPGKARHKSEEISELEKQLQAVSKERGAIEQAAQSPRACRTRRHERSLLRLLSEDYLLWKKAEIAIPGQGNS